MGNLQQKSLSGSNKSLPTTSSKADIASVAGRSGSLFPRSPRLKSRSLINHPGIYDGISATQQSLSSKENDPYKNSKTVWPSLTLREIPFLPEFQVQSRMFQSSFEVLSIISSGAYGKVYRVTHRGDGKTYAMKSISKSKIITEDAVRQIKDEVRILSMCGHHPFLVPCAFHWQRSKNLYIVTEFIDGGDLQQLWHQTGWFDEDLVRLYIGELALILDFLHNAGVIYRDLKMENILIDDRGHIRLIDFGLSKWLSIGDKTKTMCGTLLYMAPEVLCQDWYTHAVDWWSLGVLMYALLQGTFPFREMSGEQTELEFGEPDLAEPARRLVRNLLTREPRQRLRSLRTLQNHAFYHHFDFEKLQSKQVDPLPLLLEQRRKVRAPSIQEDENTLNSFG